MELTKASAAMQLSEIAKAVGMPASKVHRYLVSLCRSGLVEQDPATSRYDLSRSALRLGLAALGRLDEFRLADNVMRELHEASGAPVSAHVWGERGPVTVRRAESVHPLMIGTRLGASISVVNSASGRVFAAFLPATVVDPVIAAELAQGVKPIEAGNRLTKAQFKALLAQVRKTGLADTQGGLIQGLNSLAAPVFDMRGDVVLVLAILSIAGVMDFSQSGPHAKLLLAATQDLSHQLGYRSVA
jgi:DNA-binding IclR family transcriptional regulator